MEQINNILDSLTESIDKSIRDFAECRDLAQKKSYAEIIKLLCDSMGVFFNAMNNSDPDMFDDYYDDEDNYDEDDYEEDYEDEVKKHRKAKKGKKRHEEDTPF